MSGPNTPRRDLVDLSVYARRGHASRAEERLLLQALERDEELRVAHRVGLDFDAEGAVRAGDEQRIARAADAALARLALAAGRPAPVAVPPARRAWIGVLQHAAAVLLIVSLTGGAGAAAMWVAGVGPWRATAPTHVETAPAPSASKPNHKPRPRALAATAAEPPAAVAAAPQAAPAAAASTRASRGSAAAALFHAANSARRAGELARARQLYTALIARAPDSDEAHVAHVSLGKLLLGQGQARAAERAFQRYLVRGGGALSEEALFGRAQSLARLGQHGAEASAWRALLGAYPDSVYAAEARQRLEQLGPTRGQAQP